MKVIENQCVQCGLPCLGKSCPHQNVVVHYCDFCQTDIADYQMNDRDYCKDCAQEYLNFYFDDMTISEQTKLFGFKIIKLRKTE